MEHISPLLQTILWVALVTGIVWRFHAPLDGLLRALQGRIEAGSSVKAGPFELGQVRTQRPAEQVQKTQSEVEELLAAQAEELPDQQRPPEQIRAQLLEAEDLALRAVQTDYGQPVSRQVSLGPDLQVDGSFTVDGQLNIVEVKHFIRPKRVLPIIRSVLERFETVLRKNQWRRVKVVLAIVLHDATDLEGTKRQVQALASDFAFPVDVRCYALSDLRATFALD